MTSRASQSNYRSPKASTVTHSSSAPYYAPPADEYPPNSRGPKSVASFAAPSVSPWDSVSQIGSRPPPRSGVIVPEYYPPSERSHYSQHSHRSHQTDYSPSQRDQSESGSTLLTEGNLAAHNAEPLARSVRSSAVDRRSRTESHHPSRVSGYDQIQVLEPDESSSERHSRVRSSHHSRSSRYDEDERLDPEVSRARSLRSRSEAPSSRTPTVTPSRIERATTPQPRSIAPPSTMAREATWPAPSPSRPSPSMARTLAPSQAHSSGPRSPPYRDLSPPRSSRSYVSQSKANTKVSSHSSSKHSVHTPTPSEHTPRSTPSASHSHYSSTTRESNGYSAPSPSRTWTSVPIEEPPQYVSVYETVPRDKTGDTYLVEVERMDEQVAGRSYQIRRKHMYPAND